MPDLPDLDLNPYQENAAQAAIVPKFLESSSRYENPDSESCQNLGRSVGRICWPVSRVQKTENHEL